MTKTHTFALVTHGCKVNQYESHSLREAWTARGLIETGVADAQTVCINTCAVTAGATADARAAVRRAHRENPDAAILVTGCSAQAMGKEFWRMDGVTMVVPQRQKTCLLRSGETLLPGGCMHEDCGGDAATPVYPPFTIMEYDRSRAVLKAQDGCSHRCTYCIVPLTRGPSRSRKPAETVAEARRLLEAGFRELVLNGINLAQYGRDFADAHDFWDLAALLERELAPEWSGTARIRLSSLEPGQLDRKALDTLGDSALIAPHLHISLQSGSGKVLRRMGRGHYAPDVLHGFCEDLRDAFPRFGLGADILSGFPGETEADASETEALCRAVPFTYAHVFPYSRRPGTPAATWPDQVDPDVRKERAARLRDIFAAKKEAFLTECLDLPSVCVACESATDAEGRPVGGVNEFYGDCRFAPGAAPEPAAHRCLVSARPVRVSDGHLEVEAVL